MKALSVALLILIVSFAGCTDEPVTITSQSDSEIGSIEVRANPEIIDPTNADARSVVTVTCLDAKGKPVAGQSINIETSLGSITQGGLTGEDGVVTALFDPKGDVGTALVEASTSASGRIIKGEARIASLDPAVPVSIRVTATPNQIQPHGLGGTETSVLRCEVLNGIGAPVTEDVELTCELVNQPDPPQGCLVNGHEAEDSEQTRNGVALFGINAGLMVGPVLIRISEAENPNTIFAIVSNFAVVAGSPAAIGLDVDNWGWDVGGAWEIEVAAIVYDANTNPVADNVAVGFSVQPDDIGSISPATTGNMNRSGIATPGVATARLIYSSIQTFSPVTISATVHTANGQITASRETALPLQKGYLSLNVDPGAWMFDREREEDTCLVRCWAVLKDGHDVTINNAPILFTADRARFFWRDQVGGRLRIFNPEPARKFTGVVNQNHNEPAGTATVYLRGRISDFYVDDITLQVPVKIQAVVEGYGYVSAEPRVLTVVRH